MRRLEQIALTASDLQIAVTLLFCYKQSVLEGKKAMPLKKIALTVLGLQIASTPLFLSKKSANPI